MAIIEIQESKFEHLSECAEKLVKYGKKMMECLEEVDSKDGHFVERYGRRYGNREDREYSRYY